MLDRMVVGEVPAKHHIALRDDEGNLRHEQCITRSGFDGPYTIAYHVHRPHAHQPCQGTHGFALPEAASEAGIRKRHFRSSRLSHPEGPAVDGRRPLLFNRDVVVSMLGPTEPDPVYFQNGDGDDLYFIVEGGGVLRTPLGDLRFGKHDYVCVPKGVLHRFIPDAAVAQQYLCIECLGGVGLPSKWRNETGQLRMDAPYCHRDFVRPTFDGPRDEGIREIVVKRTRVPGDPVFSSFRVAESPLSVVGWDGTVYPWAFPILSFQPRAGQVHLPPDWHGTFAARGALICSFVPRVVDFHPQAIPCPYPHSSVDCDEMLLYLSGSFTSRRGIGPGSMSLHPAGLAHGPHPGAYEASVGVTHTDELAVMMDTVGPLMVTPAALEVEDAGYMESFVSGQRLVR